MYFVASHAYGLVMSARVRRLLAFEIFCYQQAIKCYEAKQVTKANAWSDLGDSFRARRMQ